MPQVLDPGVYTLQDMREYGRKKGWCPYFLARHMLAFANVMVYNYQYMLDPKVQPQQPPCRSQKWPDTAACLLTETWWQCLHCAS